MIDPKFKEKVIDVVINALKAEGYSITGNDNRYTFAKGRARTNVYKYKERDGHYYTMANSERRLKHSNTIIKNIKVTTEEQLKSYAKSDLNASKLSEAEKMFTALGYDTELIRLSATGNYVSVKLDLGLFDNVATKFTWSAEETVSFKLFYSGECYYELSTSEINIPLLEKSKTAINKIRSAWEISIL